MPKASLLEEFLAAPRRPYPRCSISAVQEQLTDERREKLTAAIAEHSIEASRIAHVLKDWGHGHIKAPTIARHRRGDCSCGG